jgi:hypothetical protein
VPNRSATPGSHQTGSTATLVTEISPASWTISPSTSSRPAAIACWISCRVRRALVIAIVAYVDAVGDMVAEILRDAMAPGVERDDLAGLAPLRVRSQLEHRRRVLEVRPRLWIHRPGGDGECAVDRIGAAMGADRVAIRARIDRGDDRATLAEARRAPCQREPHRAARTGVRRQPYVAAPADQWWIHPVSLRDLAGGAAQATTVET